MIAIAYITAIVAANFLVFALGPWWSPVNAFLLIGLDLVLRDRLHDQYGLSTASCFALAAAAISYLMNPAGASIALASAISFGAASLADGSAYQALRGHRYMTRTNGSNSVGAAVDSVIFPTIAFGALMPEIVALQFAAKVCGGFLWSIALRRLVAA